MIFFLRHLLDKLKLKSSCDAIPASETQKNTSDYCDFDDDLERKIRLCSSLKEIENILDNVFHHDRVNFILYCTACISDDVTALTSELILDKSGVFNVSDIEVEKLKARSKSFRNLTGHLVAHVKSDSHIKNSIKREEQLRQMAAISPRNTEISNKIGSVAYFFFNTLPFLLFERFLPWFSLHKIDIDQINHSEIFLRRLLDPYYKELVKRLQSHMRQPIEYMDSPILALGKFDQSPS